MTEFSTKLYAIREISVQSISQYILEDIIQDVDYFKRLKIKGIQKIRNTAKHNNKIVLIS